MVSVQKKHAPIEINLDIIILALIANIKIEITQNDS